MVSPAPIPDRTRLWLWSGTAASLTVIGLWFILAWAGTPFLTVLIVSTLVVVAVVWLWSSKRPWWGPGPAAWEARRKAERKVVNKWTMVAVAIAFAASLA